jgi:small subunit ribosomal protein S1
VLAVKGCGRYNRPRPEKQLEGVASLKYHRDGPYDLFGPYPIPPIEALIRPGIVALRALELHRISRQPKSWRFCMMETQQTQGKTPLSSLKIKDMLNGKVTRIGLSGAIIDVGAEREGLLHISALGQSGVTNAQDVFQVGQDITVWVRKVNPEKGELQLTTVQPLAHDWSDIKAGTKVTGKITRVEKFGAFLDFGAERPGMIHVSELSMDYVKDPNEVVKVGDTVDAVILEVDRTKKQIRLSRKVVEVADSAPEPEEADTEPAEKPLTSMEAAFLKAQATPEEIRKEAVRASRKREAQFRRQQEDLLMRTLQTSTRK